MTTKKNRKARMTGTTKQCSKNEEKEYYGIYDLTEDLTGISRTDSNAFDTERKKIESLVKGMMSSLGYPKGTLQIPAKEYKSFFSYIDVIYNGTVGGKDARLIVNKLGKNKIVEDGLLTELCEKIANLKRQELNELAADVFDQWFENTMAVEYYKRENEIKKEIDEHIKSKISAISDKLYYQETKIKMLEFYQDMLYSVDVIWDSQLEFFAEEELPLKEKQDDLFNRPTSVVNEYFNQFIKEIENMS